MGLGRVAGVGNLVSTAAAQLRSDAAHPFGAAGVRPAPSRTDRSAHATTAVGARSRSVCDAASVTWTYARHSQSLRRTAMPECHERISVHEVDTRATEAVLGLESYMRSSGFDRQLYELVKIRASQLNGCAYCLDMHTRDARVGGEDQRRLDVLSAWREAPALFTERERAALGEQRGC